MLNILASCSGIVGGILWFLAASRTPTPPQGSCWGVVDSPISPIARVWRKASWFNQAAVLATGISALLFGISAFFQAMKSLVLVDTQGLPMLAVVYAADIQDRDGGVVLLGRCSGSFRSC